MSFHLAIDLSESEQRPTGVGTFAMALVEQWLPRVEKQQLELTLCVRDPAAMPPEWEQRGVEICASGRGNAHPIVWQQTWLPRALRSLRPDAFFGPAYSLPHFLGTPAAVALHDLSFERFPQDWKWRESWRRRLLARSAARRARAIVTISEFSAGEIADLYGVDRRKIHVVPLGVRSDLTQPSADTVEDVRRRYGLSSEPILLHVGTLLPRRHLPVLLDAVAKMSTRCQVAIVGQEVGNSELDLTRRTRELGLEGRIHHLPYLPSEDLAALYAASAAYVSLSDYEGFGLPVLEALSYGTPALVLEIGASAELWSQHAMTVASLDSDAVAKQLENLLQNPQLGLRERQSALERHTWECCASDVLRLLQEIST